MEVLIFNIVINLSLRSLYMYTTCFEHHLPTSLCSNSSQSLLMFNPLCPISAACIHMDMGSSAGEYAPYQRIHYWKFDSPSPTSHQLLITLQLGMGPHEPLPIHAGMLTGLILLGSCVGNYSFCEFVSPMALSYPEDIVLSCLPQCPDS